MIKIEIITDFNSSMEEIMHYSQCEEGFRCSNLRLNSNGDWQSYDYDEIISCGEMLDILHQTTESDLVNEITDEVLDKYRY